MDSDLQHADGYVDPGAGRVITIVKFKYLNNIVEQDHRFIKRITQPMLGFKVLHSTLITIAGSESADMI